MSRRKSDQQKDRLVYFLLMLCSGLSILAAIMGYKAIISLDDFDKSVRAVMDKYSDHKDF